MVCRTTGTRTAALSLLVLLTLGTLSAARAETIDQLYEKAKLEKALVFYTGAGPAAAKAVAAAFEKRFPGIAVTAKGGFSNVLDVEIDRQLKDNNVTADFVQFRRSRTIAAGTKRARFCISSRKASTRFSTP